MSWEVRQGDCLPLLRAMPASSVQCVVTSPPYWGLRDYGTAEWDGGDEGCDHAIERPERSERPRNGLTGGLSYVAAQDAGSTAQTVCECGATRIDSQLGLEPTPDQYVANLVEVFAEVRRVLRDDGTVWLNLGDSYWSDTLSRKDPVESMWGNRPASDLKDGRANLPKTNRRGGLGKRPPGLKPKDLCGIPWRVAFALQADGWVLRSEVIWQKPNPMPESVTDRPTRAHEQIFLLSKAKWSGPAPGRFGAMSDEDARWLALLIDAEGNICIKRAEGGMGVQLAVAGTHRGLLETAQAIVGTGNILERKGTNAPVYYWQVSNKVARDLLLRLYPHFIVKHRQARIGIYFESLLGRSGQKPSAERTVLLDGLWEANKACNSFGDPDLLWVPEPKFGRWTSQPYFYDADAVREPHNEDSPAFRTYAARGVEPTTRQEQYVGNGHSGLSTAASWSEGGRNKRSVWTVATQPFPGAHFATFPPKLIEPCILAGTSPKACGECGAPWERVTERKAMVVRSSERSLTQGDEVNDRRTATSGTMVEAPESVTVGWQPTCPHQDDSGQSLVLDPFCGSGTVGMVALRHNRSFIGLELSPAYCQMARHRIVDDQPLFNHQTEVAA